MSGVSQTGQTVNENQKLLLKILKKLDELDKKVDRYYDKIKWDTSRRN